MLLQLPHHRKGKQVIFQQAFKEFLNIRTNLMMTLPQNSAFTALGTTLTLLLDAYVPSAAIILKGKEINATGIMWLKFRAVQKHHMKTAIRLR